MLISLIDIQIFGMFLLVCWILENIKDFFLQRIRSKRRFRELEQKSKQVKLLCEVHATRLHLERLCGNEVNIDLRNTQARELFSAHVLALEKIRSVRRLLPEEDDYCQICFFASGQGVRVLPAFPPSFLE